MPRSVAVCCILIRSIELNEFWSRQQCAFFDIRVFYPQAQSYRNQPIATLLKRNEAEKKRQYNDRIIQVERGTFTPLVFSTNGVMGQEARIAMRKLATEIANKRKEPFSSVMGLLCCRISFALIRAAITCLRGTRRRMVPFEDNNVAVVLHEASVDF